MNKWDRRFLGMAALVASWSKDPSTKVGCVLVDPKLHRVVGTGFNGLPHGVDDRPELLISREEKMAFTIHAEENALIYAGQTARGMTCYCTHPPCSTCAVKLIQAGIARVCIVAPRVTVAGGEDFITRWSESTERANAILHEAGVVYDAFHIDEPVQADKSCECARRKDDCHHWKTLHALTARLGDLGTGLVTTSRSLQGTQAACRSAGQELLALVNEVENRMLQDAARL